jgi:hypothetical protein
MKSQSYSTGLPGISDIGRLRRCLPGKCSIGTLPNAILCPCPLSGLSATKQVRLGDVVTIDVDSGTQNLAFFRDRSEVSLASAALESGRRAGAAPGRIAP